jgi:hypothetical protein
MELYDNEGSERERKKRRRDRVERCGGRMVESGKRDDEEPIGLTWVGCRGENWNLKRYQKLLHWTMLILEAKESANLT